MNEKEAKEKILNIVDRCAWDHELDSHEATDRIYDEVVRPAERKVTHLYDVYDSLGIKWGDDPFNAIAKLKAELEERVKDGNDCIDVELDKNKKLKAEVKDWKNVAHDTHTEDLAEIDMLKARLDSAIIVFKEASNEPCPNWCKSRQAVAQFLNEGGDNAD